jgi:hypothetical protein
MPEKILYILGAGASAYSLPLARSVYKEGASSPVIRGLAYEMARVDYNYLRKNYPDPITHEFIAAVGTRLNNLSKKADEFGDVDTYAKYFHLINPGGAELQELKRTLSEYFVLKQIVFKARDPRYLPWLVSIMDRKKFPENVKILNWNYDFQVQLASTAFGELEDVEHKAASFTYSASTISHYPNIDPAFHEFDELSLIHLNGIAGFNIPEDINLSSVFQKSNVGNVMGFLTNERNKLSSAIHFAWDQTDYHSNLLQHVKKMVLGTTILVVIGYSYPFFNRNVDKQIFEDLKSRNTLRKIYYQDPNLDGQQLKAQFDLYAGLDIVHIPSTTNFHIPFEY